MDLTFSSKRNGLFLLAYLGLRVFSYFFEPATVLHGANWLNSIVAIAYALTTMYFLIKKPTVGWSLVFLELILDGSGGFFSIGAIALRTWLLLAAIIFFFGQKIISKTFILWFKKEKTIIAIMAFLAILVTIGIVHGLITHNSVALIYAEAIPYCFLFYYFPLKEQLANPRFRELGSDELAAAIIGNALFALTTLVLFSSNTTVLQSTFYHWFRDVAGGKITPLPFNFYRIVLNEQLLLIPVLLILFNPLIRQQTSVLQKRWLWLLIICCLAIYAVNLTRIDLIALAIGYLFLFSRANWKRWLSVAGISLVSFALVFTGIHLAASRGHSLGWEIFGLRLQSIVSPTIEDSSLSRLLTLPKALAVIKAYPILGAGLGTTISVYSPVLKTTITTSDFDWGYLQMIGELGLIGFIAWLIVLLRLGVNAWHGRLWRGTTAVFIALLISNVTSPALFNVFGCLLLAFLLASSESAAL